MRKPKFAAAVAFAAVASATTLLGALLGVNPGLPTTTFSNPSSLNYSAATGVLAIQATPTSTKFDWLPNPVIRLFDLASPRSLAIGMTLNSDGTLAGGVAGDDLVLKGRVTGPDGVLYDGNGATPLLTGEVDEALGSLNDPAIDLFDARFHVTGGLLAPFYAGFDAGVTIQSDNPTTFAGSFTADFAGNAKGSIGPIPKRLVPCTASIGDFVWHDENRNGIQDANEHGINGVTVTLTPSAGAAQITTTANSPTGQPGYYQFKNLCAGEYQVSAATPTGTLPAPSFVGASDSDSNGSPAIVTLPSNSSTDQTIDFGFVTICTGAIGDFVWSDVNDNGVQDASEPGVNGVVLQLLDGNGVVIATTTTSNAPSTGQPGYYQFDGLCAGAYRVHVITPAGVDHLSPANQGGDDSVDSDVNPSTGTAAVTLTTDTNVDLTIDIGLVPPAPCVGAIGDFVWNDLNGNGLQDLGEPGLNGVLVELRDGTGTLQQTNTTTHDGHAGFYQFTGLSCSGSYQVWVTRPAAYTRFSPTDAGADETIDSDGAPTQSDTYSVAAVTLSESTPIDDTIDFGFYACRGTIGDYVWRDVNGNGVQDAGEPGIPNVTLLLQDGDGHSLGVTAQTDANGYYQFTGLCAGSYRVVVLSGVPAQHEPTASEAGNDRTVDNNGSPAPVTLTSDFASNATIDFGYRPIPPAALGDFVWLDANANGQQDAGESGLPGVTVRIYTCAGALVNETVTGADGAYLFANLVPGCYYVRFAAVSGFMRSATDVGNDASDSDADETGASGQYVLVSGQTDRTVDAGFYQPPYKTYTMGGWGAAPSGNNPGTLLRDNFARLYRNGVVIGGSKKLTFTSALAIQNYLPAGETPGVLKTSRVNPLTTEAGVFAGQTLALKLNVDFSAAGLIPRNLGALRVAAGNPLAGYTVAQVLSVANSVLGGGALPAGVSVSALNDLLGGINGNFDNGLLDNHLLVW
jgi:hypothetical protein